MIEKNINNIIVEIDEDPIYSKTEDISRATSFLGKKKNLAEMKHERNSTLAGKRY